jgi:hypothetical protein
MAQDGESVPHATALRIRLGDEALREIRVVVRPVASAHSLLMDTLGNSNGGAGESISNALRSQVDVAALAAYQLMARPGQSFYPDVLVPEFPPELGWPTRLVEEIAEADPGAVTEQLLEQYGGAIPARWRSVIESPGSYLSTVAGAVRDTSEVLDRLVSQGAPRFEIEVARLSDALTTNTPGALLNALSRQVSYVDGELRIAYGQDICIELRGHLVLVPLLAGPRSFMLYDVGDDLYLGYPMRGSLASVLNEAPVSTDRLVSLVGPSRARALRELNSPRTMGNLARTLECAPSTATYTCRTLTDAGLVNVVRVGRAMWVARTPEGDALVSLLSD